MTNTMHAEFFRARAVTLRAQADELPREPTFEGHGTQESAWAKALLAEAAIFEKAAASLDAEAGQLSETLKLALREADEKARDDYADKWLDVPCRFSGDGREGCFIAPVNRHGGPCVPCWARARQRMWEQKQEIAKLKGGKS